VDIALVIKTPEPLLYADLQPVVAADHDGRLTFDLAHEDVLEAVWEGGGGGRGGDESKGGSFLVNESADIYNLFL